MQRLWWRRRWKGTMLPMTQLMFGEFAILLSLLLKRKASLPILTPCKSCLFSSPLSPFIPFFSSFFSSIFRLFIIFLFPGWACCTAPWHSWLQIPKVRKFSHFVDYVSSVCNVWSFQFKHDAFILFLSCNTTKCCSFHALLSSINSTSWQKDLLVARFYSFSFVFWETALSSRDPSEEKIVENFLDQEGVEEDKKFKILKIIRGMGEFWGKL